MSNAKDKLLEADYFLECMKDSISDRVYFRFNLSAFLSAARSVTLIMQTEFNDLDGFKEWYSEIREKLEQDIEMKLLNDKRVMTIHQQPVRPQAKIIATFNDHVVVNDAISILVKDMSGVVIDKVELKQSSPSEASKTASSFEWQWYFDELPNKDIITLCEENIKKLKSLVEECERKFLPSHYNGS